MGGYHEHLESTADQRALVPNPTVSPTTNLGQACSANKMVDSRLTTAHFIRKDTGSSVQLSQKQIKRKHPKCEHKYHSKGDWHTFLNLFEVSVVSKEWTNAHANFAFLNSITGNALREIPRLPQEYQYLDDYVRLRDFLSDLMTACASTQLVELQLESREQLAQNRPRVSKFEVSQSIHSWFVGRAVDQ